MRPARIRLSRAAGFRLDQASMKLNGLPAVVVARPSRWGNPFVVARSRGRDGTRAECVHRFAMLAAGLICISDAKVHPDEQTEVLRDLRRNGRQYLQGRNLACWCPAGAPCHADVLIAFVNRRPGEKFDPRPWLLRDVVGA